MTAYIRYLPADDECGFCSSVLNGQEYDVSELMAKDSTYNGISPDTDIYEKDEKIIFETELPGLSKNDIKIKVQEDILSVSAQKSVDASRKFLRKERVYGKLERTFRLPKDYDINSLNARYENGVLTLELSKIKNDNKVREVQVL